MLITLCSAEAVDALDRKWRAVDGRATDGLDEGRGLLLWWLGSGWSGCTLRDGINTRRHGNCRCRREVMRDTAKHRCGRDLSKLRLFVLEFRLRFVEVRARGETGIGT